MNNQSTISRKLNLILRRYINQSNTLLLTEHSAKYILLHKTRTGQGANIKTKHNLFMHRELNKN